MATAAPDTRGYTKIKGAARYAGVSERTMREWIKKGLTHIRLDTGRILIAYSAIDEYLEKQKVSKTRVDALVEETLRELGGL